MHKSVVGCSRTHTRKHKFRLVKPAGRKRSGNPVLYLFRCKFCDMACWWSFENFWGRKR